MVKKINTAEFNSMDKSGVAVIDFNAVWCAPCRMLAPVLEELSEDYAGRVSFYAIDTDENSDLSAGFGIMSIPAVIIMKDGKQVDMSIGFVPKTNIASLIEKNL